MSSSVEVLRLIAIRLLREPVVLSVRFLETKVRAVLKDSFILDIYYNAATKKYSYTLLKEDRRIAGWNNAPHHIRVSTHPHHFHDVDGCVKPSNLAGDPLADVDKVLEEVKRIICA